MANDKVVVLVPLDKQLDEELLDAERNAELERIADEELFDLECERAEKGYIE